MNKPLAAEGNAMRNWSCVWFVLVVAVMAFLLYRAGCANILPVAD